MRAVLFVDEALHNGEGVLVHCAQVRTAVSSDYAACLTSEPHVLECRNPGNRLALEQKRVS